MDTRFYPAMAAIYAGDVDQLREMLAAEPALATDRSSCSHPSLLQCVAVDAGLGKVPRATELAELLIASGADQLQDAVLAAASTAAAEVMWTLLDHGARLDQGSWRPLDEALYWSHNTFATDLVDRGAPVDRLRSAAGLGDIERMADFFDGAGELKPDAGPINGPFADRVDPSRAREPDEILAHALVIATLNARYDAMAWLVDRGADVNRKPTGFHWGGNAVHAAVWRDDRTAVAWLLEHGADMRIKDDSYGADALGWARHHKHTSLTTLFERRAAD